LNITRLPKQKEHENLVLMPWATSQVTSYQATC
jgi:hypothetical protein